MSNVTSLLNDTATTDAPLFHSYSSRYGIGLTVFFATLAATTSIITVLGNAMVLVSFVLDRQIRQPANYFIASLALTDFLIGFFSMPLYTMYLLLGSRWPLGTVACDLWLSLDYTVCLTSQYTVFFITLDRYCSVSFPARYRAWRSETKLKVMVLLTWILPAFIFHVSIIGWPYFVGERTVPLNMCYVQFMENPLFNTALVISYYWTTLVVITVLYVGIYRVALEMANKAKRKRLQAERIIAQAQRKPSPSVDPAQPSCGTTTDGASYLQAPSNSPSSHGHRLSSRLFSHSKRPSKIKRQQISTDRTLCKFTL